VPADEVVQLARAVVVDDDDEAVAARRLDLKLTADAGEKCFADGGHGRKPFPEPWE
jgi:hypothetical protein